MVLEDINGPEQHNVKQTKGGEYVESLKLSGGNNHDDAREPSDSGDMYSVSDSNSECSEGYADFLNFLNDPGETPTKKEASVPPPVVTVPPPVVTVEQAAPVVSHKKNARPSKVLEHVAKLETSASQRRGKMDKKPSAQDAAKEVPIAPTAAAPVSVPAPVVKESVAPASNASERSATAPPAEALKPKESIRPTTSTADETSVAPSVAASAASSVHVHSEAPVAVGYFTKLAAQEKAKNSVKMRELSLEHMSVSARYFDKKTKQQAIKHNAKVAELLEAPRPAAVEYFTLKGMEDAEAKKQAIADKADAPAAFAVQHFTDMANVEREKKKAEIKELKANPPQASMAGQHFSKVNEKKKVEMEETLKQPASVATEYFNKKAEDERKKSEMAASNASNSAHVASLATQHFQKIDEEKTSQREAAAQSVTTKKEYVEPLPVDYFTKQGDAEMDDKAKEQWDRAEAQMSVGARYFTAKGEEDKLLAIAEQKKNSELNMSMATRHFSKKAAEKEANTQVQKVDNMPLAVQHFTVKDRKVKDKKKAEIQAMHDTPHDMAPGQAYFTNQSNAEKEKKAVEIEELKKNPPPASMAGQHFAKINEKKKVEMKELVNAPASVAGEYFNKKAQDEKRSRSSQSSGETPHVASLATQHFQHKGVKKAQDIEAARARSQTKKTPMKPIPADYFTKLGNTETAERAQAKKEMAEAQASSATKYFTSAAPEVDEAPEVSEVNMSTATLHFSRSAKSEAKKKQGAEVKTDMMPVGIQYFSMKAQEERQAKKDALEASKGTPHAMSVGQSHFTKK